MKTRLIVPSYKTEKDIKNNTKPIVNAPVTPFEFKPLELAGEPEEKKPHKSTSGKVQSVDRKRIKVRTPSGKVVWKNIRKFRKVLQVEETMLQESDTICSKCGDPTMKFEHEANKGVCFNCSKVKSIASREKKSEDAHERILKKMSVKEERKMKSFKELLAEGRGRPRKDGTPAQSKTETSHEEGHEPDQHIMVQAKKASDYKPGTNDHDVEDHGQITKEGPRQHFHIKFQGGEHPMPAEHASKWLAKYHGLKTPEGKSNMAAYSQKSHAHFMRAID